MGANADACGRLCLTSVTNALAPRLRVCKCGVFSGVCQQICIFIRFPSGKKGREGKEKKEGWGSAAVLRCTAAKQIFYFYKPKHAYIPYGDAGMAIQMSVIRHVYTYV